VTRVIRIAQLCIVLVACAHVLTGCVQILPTVSSGNDLGAEVGCCIAYIAISKTTSGSIEVQKSPTHWAVSTKFRTKF